jgi:hypothetical protein
MISLLPNQKVKDLDISYIGWIKPERCTQFYFQIIVLYEDIIYINQSKITFKGEKEKKRKEE